MIIRVRTNVGASRLEVDPNSSLSQLQELIIRTLNIGSATVTLASDLSGEHILSPNEQRLSELGIKQGSEVFVIGKFEKRIVEKSYINDQGEVVPAGQTLVQVHVEDGQQATLAAHSIKEEETTQLTQQKEQPAEQPKESQGTQKATEGTQKAGNSNDGTVSDSAVPCEVPFDYDAYNEALDYEELNGVRAPDEARKMTLLGGAAGSDGYGSYDIGSTEAGRALMLEVLTKEEVRQIDQLEESLRAAGLREYEVLQETQHLQDELIAARLQRESVMDARSMAAADLLRHGSADLLGAVHDMDASLARYHAAQRPPQPSVLRLQQFQQGNRAVTKASRGNSEKAGVKRTNTATASTTAARTRASGNTRDSDAGPTIVTDRSASQHSDITQSSASSMNNTNPRSTASSLKGSAKSRQPSKAFTDAMKELEDITQNIDELASSTNMRLSALQQGALRTLSAPTPTSAVLSTAQRTPARTLNVDTAGSGATLHRGSGSHVPLIYALSPTSTLSKSVASPAGADRAPSGTNTTSNSHSFGAFPEESPSEQKDYDTDEEALLMLLSGELQPSSRPGSAAKQPGNNSKAAATKPTAQRNATDHTPVARAHSYSAAGATHSSTAAPASSLLDSGYKTMAQVKAEREKREQTHARIGHTGRAASMSNVKAPAPSGAGKSAEAGARSERPPAPYSLQAHRGVLQSDVDGAGAGSGRVGGVATTVLANLANSSPSADLLFADEGMFDDSLALALQLSLEDSQQQQAQMRQNPTNGTSTNTNTSKVPQKATKVTTTRAKKATTCAKNPEASAQPASQPSTLLPASRRPIPVLLPPTQARRHSQDASASTGTAAAGAARTSGDGTRGREGSEPAAAAATRRLARERLEQQRRLQEQLDAETAAELMRQDEADEAAAREYQLALDRESESLLLRERLHGVPAGDDAGHNNRRNGGGAPAAALPGWLDRTVNDFANDALFDLAAQRSSQHQQPYQQPQQQAQQAAQRRSQPAAPRQPARPQRPYVEPQRTPAAAAYDTYNLGDANYMNVQYDQDDEILAQVIQNSLNEAYY